MRMILLTLALLILSSPALAQIGRSPYAGDQKREIKSLSPEEIQDYLSGHGMGLAKAAEVNHYPGPKHVLERAAELNLSERQIDETKNVYRRMHDHAVRIGKSIVEKERILDRLYAGQRISDTQMQQLILQVARLQGELRLTHLKAHLKMKRLLSSAQIAKYDELRGYGGSGAHDSHRHHDEAR